MPENKNFMLGNLVLAVALLVLLYLGKLWEQFGALAMVIWVALVAVGVLLVSKGQAGPGGPD